MYKLIVSCYYWPAGARGLRLRSLTLKQNMTETGLTPARLGTLTGVDKLVSSIERRSVRRLRVKCEVELAATLSLLDNDACVYGEDSRLIFFGQTSDLSAEGLAMVLPATIIDERFCTGTNRLKLSLHLPEGIVGLEVAPVRCERLTDAYSVNGYLLGTRITNVEHRKSFERYLESVSGQSIGLL